MLYTKIVPRVCALNPIIVDNFCDSNIDEYYYIIFGTIYYAALAGVSGKLISDSLTEEDSLILKRFNGFKPGSHGGFTLDGEQRGRRLDCGTMSMSFSHDCLWAKVLARVQKSNVQFLIEMPANLASDGFLVDIVGDLSSSDKRAIALAVMRLVMFYNAHYKNLETKDELFFFLQKSAINFSPTAKEYLSNGSQKNLLLHFNTKYGEKAYEPLDYFNPIIEVSQIWLMSYEYPFLLNS